MKINTTISELIFAIDNELRKQKVGSVFVRNKMVSIIVSDILSQYLIKK